MERSELRGVITRAPEVRREPYLTIRTKEDCDNVITTIEVLSPSDKETNSGDRKEYLNIQRRILDSQTNLLEIDLLRGGSHTVAAPYEDLRDRGECDYLVSLHRHNQPYDYEYWFNKLRDPIPVVSVPLTDDLPDFQLDLQTVMNMAYDSGPYANGIDYSREPAPTLSEATADWAKTLLRAKGVR